MKVIKTSICASILLAGFALADGVPTGHLNAQSQLVRVDSKASLDWAVQFPNESVVEDIVTVDGDDDTITTLVETRVQVRLLGAGYGTASFAAWLESYVQFSDESSRQNFFTGTGDFVDSEAVLKERIVPAGIELNMGFRGTVSASASTPVGLRTWNSWRELGVGHGAILILQDGDAAPSFRPEVSTQVGAETFLQPYLSADSSEIKIGPRDLVILVDLNRDSASDGADFQDFVILMTFDDQNL